jgi:hypothetical protein
MGKTVRQRKALKAVVAVCCVFTERSDLSFIATEGGEQAAREAKRTAGRRTEQSRIHFPLRQIVSASTFRKPRRARVVTRRGVARRAAEEEEERA